MASGSRARGHGSAATGADAQDTPVNPDLARQPAVDHRDGGSGSDIADVALVVAVLKRKLAEAEARIRADQAEARIFADTIRVLELRVANAEALARGRTVAAGEDDQSQGGDHLTARDVGPAAELTGGEIRVRDLGAGEITPGVGFEAGDEVGDEDNIPNPSPISMVRIDASPVPVTAAPALPDELMIEERAVEEVVVNLAAPRSHDEVAEAEVLRREKASEAIARKRKEAASDLSLQLDDLRVTSHKVSEEEAQGEDAAANRHRRSQGEQQSARGATNKARKQKVPSFYNQVLIALKQKENELLKKKEEEDFAKKAAAAAAVEQLHCKCYWSDSGDGESSQK